jgi:hypothetical protein
MNLSFRSQHIQIWPVERLVPYARNARLHSDTQIAQIAASIREFGFTNPILVDGACGIIAGHARLAAARTLGLAEVPVIVLDHLTEVQKRAYILVDNKLAENAVWHEEMLAVELQTLAAEAFELSLTGFSDTELDRLLAQIEAEPLVEEDSAPVAAESAITHPGELWVLGPHRVICGDALEPTTYDRLLEGGCAAMVFTDPPYNVAYQSDSRPIANDDLGISLKSSSYEPAGICLTPVPARRTSACHPLSWRLCRRRLGMPAGIGRRSSSGPNTRLPWGARITSGSMSRFCTAGKRAAATTGVATAIRAMCGRYRSRP